MYICSPWSRDQHKCRIMSIRYVTIQSVAPMCNWIGLKYVYCLNLHVCGRGVLLLGRIWRSLVETVKTVKHISHMIAEILGTVSLWFSTAINAVMAYNGLFSSAPMQQVALNVSCLLTHVCYLIIRLYICASVDESTRDIIKFKVENLQISWVLLSNVVASKVLEVTHTEVYTLALIQIYSDILTIAFTIEW